MGLAADMRGEGTERVTSNLHGMREEAGEYGLTVVQHRIGDEIAARTRSAAPACG